MNLKNIYFFVFQWARWNNMFAVNAQIFLVLMGKENIGCLKRKNPWFLCNGFIRVLRQCIQICCVFFPDILHRSNWGLRRWLHGFVEFQKPKQSS